MSVVPCPEPEEPQDSGLPGDGEDCGEGEGFQEQGLFVTLPAEELSLEGFCEGARTDTMVPGALLSMILGVAAGDSGESLAQLSDEQLIGFISGVARMKSWNAWAEMAALREFASRPRPKNFTAADQIAFARNQSPLAATADINSANTVARRLPLCFAALAAGKLRPYDVAIIEDETSILSDEDAATADAELAGAAQGKTYAQVRAAAHKLVLKLDPKAVAKRKEQAKRDVSVRCFREQSGNAGISGREMSSVEVLASMQHIQDRARELREAGMPGTWEELKARAMMDLLQEHDSRLTFTDPAAGGTADGGGAEDAHAGADEAPKDGSPEDGNPGDGGQSDGGPGGGSGPRGNGGPGGSGPAGSAAGPRLAALVNITIPYTIWHGDTGPPGEIGGFGILDHPDTREAAAAAARSPDSRWCVTLLDPDGTAAAHGCAPGARHWPTGPPGDGTSQELLEGLKIKNLDAVARGPCDHSQEEDRYRPSRKLQHLIRARNATCTAPGCGRRAASCDLDHTAPHHQGGRTCECNLAPLCRHHHHCKQAEGWRLDQAEPGVLIWHTPAGRSYTTRPTQYAA